MTPAQLLARLCDAGIVLEVRAGELHYRGPRAALTPELVSLITEGKAQLLDLLRRSRFTAAELAALGFRGTRCRDGSGFYEVRVPIGAGLGGSLPSATGTGEPARPIEHLIAEFDSRGVRFLLYSEGAREQLGYLESPGASIFRIPEPLLRELLAREKEVENFVRSKGWRWTEPGAPMGGPTQ